MLSKECKCQVKGIFCSSLLALCFFTSSIAAQEAGGEYVSDDAGKTTGGIWTEIGVAKVLPYNLSIGLDAGFRTNDWFNEASRFDIGAGLSWKPNKHWKIGVGYTFIMKHYPSETAHKSVVETEWKYRNAATGENVDLPDFMAAPIYTSDNGTVDDTSDDITYRYRGKNVDQKDYTRLTEAFWRAKHRINVEAAYTYKLWKLLRVTLRERYQLSLLQSKEVSRVRTGTKTTMKYRDPSYTTAGTVYDESTIEYDEVEGPIVSDAGEETTKEKSSKTLHTLRSRLTFEIDKKGWLFTPYAYAELFNDLTSSFHIDKVRASVGVEYSVAKQHRLQLGYVFNHENDDDGDQNIHAISVGYKFKF